MANRADTPPRTEQAPAQAISPFIERSLSELCNIFNQLFSTPIAFVRYNKQLQEQISALVKSDLELAQPQVVAQPLTFYVLWMGAHFLMANIYWNTLFDNKWGFPSGSAPAGVTRLYAWLFDLTDKSNIQTLLIIAFGLTLIIAVKSCFVSLAGHLLGCSLRFQTVLHASAYAFGTFIFFQYFFIALLYFATLFGDGHYKLFYSAFVYGSLALGILLVIRVNQIIRQVEGTTEFATYAAWFAGTLAWHFVIVGFAIYLLQLGGQGGYWDNYVQFWSGFLSALYPLNR